MRTALLAAVSHDLRTPLASIKASVSTVRQSDVELTADDEASLLATIEQSADRLNGLIGNLLDMSRLSTGSLEPFLRPASIDEVAPLAHPDQAGQAAQAAPRTRRQRPADRARRPAPGADRPRAAGAGAGEPVQQRDRSTHRPGARR